MSTSARKPVGPGTFALQRLGVAVVVVAVIALIAGLLRDDLAGTFGSVAMWGMTIAAIGVAMAVAVRKS